MVLGFVLPQGLSLTPLQFQGSRSTSVNDGIETTAAEKGDGMQRALMLAIIKTFSDYRREKDELGKRFLFLIDEAELHLHPTAQRQLKDALLVLADNGDQVMVNTHSSVLVVDDNAKQSIYRVEKQKSETFITHVSSNDKPQVVFDLLGGSPADLLFPHNFLIVEGRTEFELLRRVIQRYYPAKARLQIVMASGDTVKQARSMDAINTVFTPLYLTPVYKKTLVLLCDKPNASQQVQYANFRAAYPDIRDNEQLFLLPTETVEEIYPAVWRKTSAEVAAMTRTEKAELGKTVGDAITKADFESQMASVFAALTKAWEKAHK
jgi:putative ATP-dependent endonuclease of OLD family